MTKSEKIKNVYSDETRLALLEQSINNINDTLIRFEKRFDRIDDQFKGVNDEFKSIRDEMKSDFRWIITIFGGLMLGLAGLMAHGFHWF